MAIPRASHYGELDARAVESLRSGLQGAIVLPGDVAFEAARRVFNTAFDGHPAVVVRAAGESDVVRAIAFAVERDLPLAVRGGGHSLAGHGTADGAVVLDLGAMRRMAIDPRNGMASAEAGMTAGGFATQAHAHGLAASFGDSPTVGIGGLTLAGGVGYLVRKHGMTIDHLVSAEVVLADGRQIIASPDSHADLFWALRGGGGNFGVVTRFQYRLHPVGSIYGGWLVLPATRDAIRDCAELAVGAPDELTTVINIFRMPPLEFMPVASYGSLVVAVTAVYAGDLGDGERVLEPFRRIARPIADHLGPMPYPAIYRYSRNADMGPHGTAARTTFLSHLDDAVIDATVELAGRAPSAFAAGQVRVLGGAMARVSPDETAFAHRDRAVMFTTLIEFDAGVDPEPHRTWTEEFWAAVRPHGSGAYVGFLQDEGDDRIREAYPPPTYARLAAVKRAYDPGNLFRVNQNIRAEG